MTIKSKTFGVLLCRSLQNWYAGDAGFPLLGAGVVDGGAFGVDGDGDRHVFDFEFVDGFHAQIFKGEDGEVLMALETR